MIRSLCVITILAVALVLTAQQKPVTVYVQLVRGTHQDTPESEDWKPIGPRLSKKLSPVFKWPHYWEVKRHAVMVYPHQVSKVNWEDRLIEIELMEPGHSEIRLYRKGKLVRKSRQQFDSKLAIMGGDSEGDQSWFVVVRKDNPT